jgi:RNA polymerase sigma-70 factor (ECF subfamily)
MQFPTTRWTILAAASLNGDTAARRSLEILCRDYHVPVMAFLRSRGYSEADCKDLTQSFFQELLVSGAWKLADRSRGRFRTFLLAILLRVANAERDKAMSKKRGGGQIMASLDDLDTDDGFASATPAADAKVFDREWALQLMQRTMDHMAAAFCEDPHWPVLSSFLPGAGETPSYEAAAANLGITVGALKTKVHRIRVYFRERIRAAVACTVSAAHEVDEELSYLHSVLRSTDC